MNEQPAEEWTFLFTDVCRSTILLQDDSTDGRRTLIATQETVREILRGEGGHEVHCAGDGFFFVFTDAVDAVNGALRLQQALERGSVRVRIGMHTGHAERWDGEYMGIDVHRAARIAAAAHGGQILLSASTHERIGCESIDLGPHRLKDIAEPMRLFQAGTRRFDALAGAGVVGLPPASTLFVGRARELDAADRLLDKERPRLVTLTGPGGIGKTRLAIELVRRRAARHPEGAWWVDLAALGDPQLVPEAISDVLCARGDVIRFIGQRACLLALDNFEQLLGASPFIADLVRHCENLVVVVTSRTSLNLATEFRLAVEPLAEQDAVSLFCARARAAGAPVRRSKQVTAIARLVDCIPLALELAAAKSIVLSPAELLSRLDGTLCSLGAGPADVPRRHRTLRATVQWSYELLDGRERAALSRLALFSGGWTHEAAEEVFGVDIETLAGLVRKSFIRLVDMRFQMLEVIREFGLEQLAGEQDGEVRTRRLHRDYFLDLVERQYALQMDSGGHWRASFQELELEHENVHAALRFSTQPSEGRGGLDAALRMCAALRLYWICRRHCREGLQVCLGVLAGRSSDLSTAATAGACWAAAAAASFAGDLARARSLYEQALSMYEGLDDPYALAMVISDTAHLSCTLGEFDAAQSHLSRLAMLATKSQDAKLLADANYGLGRVALVVGEVELARKHLELARSGYIQVGHRSNQALVLLHQGMLGLAQARFDTARLDLGEALALARETESAMDESCILRCLGDVEASCGNHAAARALLRTALLSNFDADDNVEVALSLRSAAMLCFREGDFGVGATLLGATLRAAPGAERFLQALLTPEQHELIAVARRSLGAEFDAFQRQGAGMDLRAAIDADLRYLSRKTPARSLRTT